MRVEGLLFAVIAGFLVLAAAVYGWLSQDPAGTTMILLSGGLAIIVGFYLLFTARRMEARPEDRPDAEISEGAGEMGFFPPHSYVGINRSQGQTLQALEAMGEQPTSPHKFLGD